MGINATCHLAGVNISISFIIIVGTHYSIEVGGGGGGGELNRT